MKNYNKTILSIELLSKFQVKRLVFVCSILISGFIQSNVQANTDLQQKIVSQNNSENGFSYTNFINTLKQNHPEFLKESLNRDLAKNDIQVQGGGEDWQLELNAQQARQERLLVDFGADQIDQSLVSANLSRQIWKTGANVSLGVEKTIDDNSYGPQPQGFPINNPTSSDRQQVSLAISQPLLKNYKASQSSLAYSLSQQNYQASELQVLEAQEAFLSQMSIDYLDWALLKEQLNINQQRFDLAKSQTQEVKKRYQKNIVEKVDWLRARDSQRLSEQQLLLSKSQYKAQTEGLARKSNISELINQSPSFSIYEFPDLESLSELEQTINQSSRQLQSLDKQDALLKLRLKSSKNSIKPELNLDVRTALKTEQQEGLAAGQEDDDDGRDYSIGLNFKQTLGNGAAKAQQQNLQIQLNQLAFNKRYLQLQLEANLYQLYSQLSEMKNILVLNKDAISSAKETTQEELKIYEQGRSDYTNVLSSRDRIKSAQLMYAQNAINYHKLYVQLQALTDQLLSSEGE